MDNKLPIGWRGTVRPSVPELDGAVVPRKRHNCTSGHALALAAQIALTLAQEHTK